MSERWEFAVKVVLAVAFLCYAIATAIQIENEE
jgi:hypothetical protein